MKKSIEFSDNKKGRKEMIVEAVETLDGWYSLHLTYQMDWAAWNQVAQPKNKRL